MNTRSFQRSLVMIGLLLIMALILAACGSGGGQATPAAPAAPVSSATQPASGQQTFGKEAMCQVALF